jgi:hypothetical protein
MPTASAEAAVDVRVGVAVLPGALERAREIDRTPHPVADADEVVGIRDIGSVLKVLHEVVVLDQVVARDQGRGAVGLDLLGEQIVIGLVPS